MLLHTCPKPEKQLEYLIWGVQTQPQNARFMMTKESAYQQMSKYNKSEIAQLHTEDDYLTW